MKPLVRFDNKSYAIKFSHYAVNNRLAMYLVDIKDQQVVMVATVNLPEYDLTPGYVLIKDWAENAGIMRALQDAGIISFPMASIPTGFVVAYECKLLIDAEEKQ